ncbi:MAG: phospholipase D-like domain-containing protein, partial [Planctomycetota bacterium]
MNPLTAGWAVEGASLLAALYLTPRILLAGKTPAATWSWFLWVWLVPVFGPFFFLMFGRSRMHRGLPRKKRTSDRASREVTPRNALTDEVTPDRFPLELQQLASVAQQVCEDPPFEHNRVTLLNSGLTKFDQLAQDLRGAKRRVFVEYYIWRVDLVGRMVADALIDCAQRGVEVKLLLDAVGSYGVTDTEVARLERAGVKVAFFHPVNPLKRRFNLNLRNHRKIVTIDSWVGYVGGINVGDEYLGTELPEFAKRHPDASSVASVEEPTPWRDAAVRIEGTATASLERIFAEDWYFSTEELIERTPPGDYEETSDDPTDATAAAAGNDALADPGQTPSGHAVVQVIASGPDEDFEKIHHVFFAAVNLARSRIWITTPYLVPDRSLLLAIEVAQLR